VSVARRIATVLTGYNNDKEAQMLLEKTHLYSSCCSIDLQGHPSSMIFISSEKARYMASFPLKNAHFPIPPSIQPQI